MKKILAIAWKDTLVRFSSHSEWVFFIVLPIAFTIILAGATGKSGGARVPLTVVDQAHSPVSSELVDNLRQSDVVSPDVQPLGTAEDRLARHEVPAVLILPAVFDLQHLEQGNVQLEVRELPDNMEALVAGQGVQDVVGPISRAVQIARISVSAAEQIRPFALPADRQSYFEQALQEAGTQLSRAPNTLKVTNGATINYDDPLANSSAGQLITWVFVPLIGLSSMFAAEREKGTLRRLLTTPTEKATYLLGTILGQVATALVQMLLLVGFGMLALKVNWGRAPAALAILLIATALAAASLGTMLGTFVKSERQAGGLSILVGMVLALLGGCWYPLELFPQSIRSAVNILPTTWAMQGMVNILLGGQGLAATLPIAGVLLAFAAVFFGFGVWRFRYE
jgi:ABC-2 type transport system permease protein